MAQVTTLMPEGRQRYYNNDGTPCAGGKLYTYAAGTTAKKTTYSDADGTVANANPLTLDAHGEAVIYWNGAYKVDLKQADGQQVTGYPVDNLKTDPASVWGVAANLLAQLAAAGAALVGFLPLGAGAKLRTLLDKLRERVSVLDFGADPTGATDSTDAFNRALAYVAGLGGGVVRVPFGIYQLTNFTIDRESVIFKGETSGYGYTKTTGSVRLIPGPGAKWVARLRGSRAGVAINAAAYSGFKSIQFLAATACDYGLVVDSGATVVEDVIVQGFAYNLMCADQMNANRFRNCAFVAAVKVNMGVCEVAANGYINPDIPGITAVSNTMWSMEGCLFRESQGFGVVLRSGVNVVFRDCGFESNKQAGLYMYRPDSSTLRMVRFENCWWENNYEDYASGSADYSIQGNRMMLIGGPNTYIAWTSAYQAGYQLVSDSQTHYGGGGDTFTFQDVSFVAAGAAQKCILILSGFKYDFYKTWFSQSGDIPNLVRVTTDAEAVHWHDPVAGNNPYALVTSITDNLGANSGQRGAYFKAGTSFGPAELGGLYPVLGVFGGPFHLPELDANDPRRADPHCFHDYKEVDNFTIAWRIDSALPFAVSNEFNSCDRHGRKVFIECEGTLTVTAATAVQGRFFCNALLPYQAARSGRVVGQVLITPIAGGAAVVNNGWSPMEMNAVASALSTLNVFAAMPLGATFRYEVSLTYTTAT